MNALSRAAGANLIVEVGVWLTTGVGRDMEIRWGEVGLRVLADSL